MDWTQLGLGGGMVVMVLAFLSFLKGERVERAKVRESFLQTIRNHIEHNTSVVKALHDWLKGRIGGN